MDWYRREGADLVLEVLVSPRAAHDALAGIAGGRLKIRLTAPPIEGAANEHLVRWLAREFGVPRRQVRIEHGERGRRKRVRLISPTKFPAGLNLGN